ncbi:MAG: hypothetical protein QOC68_2914, partial [Solirubrobacteraceae bacterium]|nr:hypothetical protein [Solirubrobacteraceae bacterium]
RLDSQSSAAAGKDVEMVLDVSQIKLFDPNGGRSLTAEQPREAATAS